MTINIIPENIIMTIVEKVKYLSKIAIDFVFGIEKVSVKRDLFLCLRYYLFYKYKKIFLLLKKNNLIFLLPLITFVLIKITFSCLVL